MQCRAKYFCKAVFKKVIFPDIFKILVQQDVFWPVLMKSIDLKTAKYYPFIYIIFGKTLILECELKFFFPKCSKYALNLIFARNIKKPQKIYFFFVIRLCGYSNCAELNLNHEYIITLPIGCKSETIDKPTDFRLCGIIQSWTRICSYRTTIPIGQYYRQ